MRIIVTARGWRGGINHGNKRELLCFLIDISSRFLVTNGTLNSTGFYELAEIMLEKKIETKQNRSRKSFFATLRESKGKKLPNVSKRFFYKQYAII